MTEDLLRRLERLEDLEAIRRLKHRYGELCDEEYNADALVELFTEDGVWDAGELYGRFVGREAMHGFFKSISQTVMFALHTAFNEIIDIDGETARARWRAIIPATFKIEGSSVPYWTFSGYDDRMRKVNGEWRFTEVRSIIMRTGPHAEGWK